MEIQNKPSWSSVIFDKQWFTFFKIVFGTILSVCAGATYYGFLEIKNKIKNQ